MKNILMITAATIALASAPAHAQLLGGLGGGLGGAGNIGGTLGSTIGGAGDSVRSATRGAGEVTGSTSGSQNVDRRSGRIEANRGANAGAGANGASLLTLPVGSAGGEASGSGSASGNGSASAQLIGTDALRGAAGEGIATTRNTVAGARDTAGSQLGQVRNKAGGLAGQGASAASGSASGSGSAQGSSTAMGGLTSAPMQLVAAGSTAAGGAGAFEVAPKMPVLDGDGDRIGRVTQLVTDSSGWVREVLVQTKDGIAAVPAGNFTGNGSVLVSAMGEADLRKQAANDQAAATQPAPADPAATGQ